MLPFPKSGIVGEETAPNQEDEDEGEKRGSRPSSRQQEVDETTARLLARIDEINQEQQQLQAQLKAQQIGIADESFGLEERSSVAGALQGSTVAQARRGPSRRPRAPYRPPPNPPQPVWRSIPASQARRQMTEPHHLPATREEEEQEGEGEERGSTVVRRGEWRCG